MLDESERTVQLGPHEKATYKGAGLWDDFRTAPGRVWTHYGSLMTDDLLERLTENSVELDRAKRIVHRDSRAHSVPAKMRD